PEFPVAWSTTRECGAWASSRASASMMEYEPCTDGIHKTQRAREDEQDPDAHGNRFELFGQLRQCRIHDGAARLDREIHADQRRRGRPQSVADADDGRKVPPSRAEAYQGPLPEAS